MKQSTLIAGWLIAGTQLVSYLYGLLNRGPLLDLTLVMLIAATLALTNGRSWAWWVLAAWSGLGVASVITAGVTYLLLGNGWVAKHFTITTHGPAGVAIVVACVVTSLLALVLLVVDPPWKWRRPSGLNAES